ncbi:CHAD domain-containing protein [Streptomyces sp. NPDC059637]|uniref:CHAD domain-containing protein n=1 Tax=Streptomyces sp. NPDC059637 TaxID=3347752 RepID=UPI0036AD9101
MAQRHSETAPDTAAPAPLTGAPGTAALPAGEVLGRYLGDQASAFLRALRLREADEAEAARRMRRSARRIGAALHTFRPLAEPEWAERLRTELNWLSGLLAHEHQYAERLVRLTDALQRLSGRTPPATEPPGSPSAGDGPTAPASTLGAARAGALLERRLTLARTRAHSAALQALGSARFHALADAVAVLVSEVPLSPAGGQPSGRTLLPLAEAAHRRLAEAADALPLGRSGYAYNFDPLHSSLTATVTVVGPGSAGEQLGTDRQDAPWHRVRVLARLSRYAMEVASPEEDPASSLQAHAGLVLQRHREAAEAAAAAASAALTPRIAPATAYALGVLHADQRQQVEAARYAFSRLWHRQMADVS